MIIPRITKPYEPGLPALGDDLENYLVTAGGSVTLKLEPGDKFKIINLEGLQQAELVFYRLVILMLLFLVLALVSCGCQRYPLQVE